MADFINKIITIIFIFILVVIGPLLFSYSSDEGTAKRLILNESSEFLDKMADKGFITYDDLDEFYLKINSHGLIMDAKVQRLKRIVSKNAYGKAITTYIATDECTVRQDLVYEIEASGMQVSEMTLRGSAMNAGYCDGSISNADFQLLLESPSTQRLYFLDSKDTLKLSINEVATSEGKRLMFRVLKIDESKLKFDLAKMIR